jgi:multiple sugar transport system permease protein
MAGLTLTRRPAAPRRAASERRRRWREGSLGALLLVPPGVMLVVFFLGPMVANVLISFHDRRLTTTASPWVGWRNWERLFADGTLGDAVVLTVIYSVVTVVVSVALGLALALYLLDRPMMRRIVATLVVLPLATSLVIASVGWKLVFAETGVLNEALGWIGIAGPNWLNEPTPAKAVIIVVGIWSQAGFALLLYQAGLASIPSSTIDAARLYAVWRGFAWKWRLIVPLLSRTTVVVVVVATTIALRSFDQVYALTKGGPAGATRTLSYLVYQDSFVFFNLGRGAAAATLLVLMVLLAVGVQFLLLKRMRGVDTA